MASGSKQFKKNQKCENEIRRGLAFFASARKYHHRETENTEEELVISDKNLKYDTSLRLLCVKIKSAHICEICEQ